MGCAEGKGWTVHKKDNKGTRLRGQEAPFTSGLSKGKRQVKTQMGASVFFVFIFHYVGY